MAVVRELAFLICIKSEHSVVQGSLLAEVVYLVAMYQCFFKRKISNAALQRSQAQHFPFFVCVSKDEDTYAGKALCTSSLRFRSVRRISMPFENGDQQRAIVTLQAI